MWVYQNTDELYHHGVLGQKWGVRRYQNADGSLTAKGKKKLKPYITNKKNNNTLYNEISKIKNNNARKIALNGAKRNEIDYISSVGNKISKKQFKTIIDSFDKRQKYLKDNLKQIQKGKKIVSKYGIDISDDPKIISRKFSSEKEYKDYYTKQGRNIMSAEEYLKKIK